MGHRFVVPVVVRCSVVAALVLVAAGCSKDSGSKDAADPGAGVATSVPSGTAATGTGPAASVAGTATSTTRPKGSTTSSTAAGTSTTRAGGASTTTSSAAAGPACTAAAVTAAASGEVPADVGVAQVRCAGGFASAVFTSPGLDNLFAVFKASGTTWVLLNAGTDAVCADAGIPEAAQSALGC